MNRDQPAPPSSSASSGLFPLTSWETVIAAREEGGAVGQAMERLLVRYYPTIERMVAIRCRCGTEEARELTHAFIVSCLRRDFLRDVGPQKGRFRTFVNACLANFLRDEHSRVTAKKRGSGLLPASLHETDEDGRPLFEVSGATVDSAINIDKAWAARVVGLSIEALERECAQAGRAELFRELRGQIIGQSPPVHAAQIAARLGATEGAIQVALHRLRRRFGELVVEEVKSSVGREADWREELRYLLDLVSDDIHR